MTSTKKFHPFPATVEVIGGDNRPRIGAVSVETVPDAISPHTLVIKAMSEERIFPIESVTELSHNEWEMVGWQDEPDFPPVRYRVRPTLPSDSEGAISTEMFPIRSSLPVEYLAYAHSNNEGSFDMPSLFALTDEEGYVSTLMLSAPTGLYLRAASMWHELVNEDAVDGLSVYPVNDGAIEYFDESDQAGQMPHVIGFDSPEGTPVRFIPERTPDPAESPIDPESDFETEPPTAVTAAGIPRAMPKFLSPDDAPDAIQAAADNPEIRWWVERRLAAFGVEAELPWATS